MISSGNLGSDLNQSNRFLQKKTNNLPGNQTNRTANKVISAPPSKEKKLQVEPTQPLSIIPQNKLETAARYLFQDGAIVSDIYASFESTIQRPQIKESAEKYKNLSFKDAYSAWRQSVIDETTQNLPKFLAKTLSVREDSEIVSQLLIKAEASVKETLPLLLDQGCKTMFEREFSSLS